MGGACGGMRRMRGRITAPSLACPKHAFKQGPHSGRDFWVPSPSVPYPRCSQSLGSFYSAAWSAAAPAADCPLPRFVPVSPLTPFLTPAASSVSSPTVLLQGSVHAQSGQALQPGSPAASLGAQWHSAVCPPQHELAWQLPSFLGQQSGDRDDPAALSGAGCSTVAPCPPSVPRHGPPRPNGQPPQLTAPVPPPSPLQLQAAPEPEPTPTQYASSGSPTWKPADSAELTGSAVLPRFSPTALSHLPGSTATNGLTWSTLRSCTAVSFSDVVEHWSSGEEDEFQERSEKTPAPPASQQQQQQPCVLGSAHGHSAQPIPSSPLQRDAGALHLQHAPLQGRLRPSRNSHSSSGASGGARPKPGAPPGGCRDTAQGVRCKRFRFRLKIPPPTEQDQALPLQVPERPAHRAEADTRERD
eukprot:TRINITY_DN55208_c0_g1_i1.p1 TRINITY_DN55208_c0_g1~~TRINITY_DN55208_c0_g1_i1.p1  ORF type:complete len:445 (+),score=76.54 TRINITY_DN55208_c0_g1_i1:94-1335(+)